ncbi:hypothetical protein TC41_2496 [Alicyclobacillus acidocaldarius subsp. acidocaldarius Tc-4-1]|uniref:Uncharacterized protein n=1 Tax=Alicyclobacillus acidocaldarius (strain Tc-4-1) TaxID=1048834 RepID=F8IH41_ALIAT|nr:hypothetical protein TC41_2496 [Alicyclobacillus acidocaldarius subsp. acidocaldarius Tc-4-1]
MNISIVERLYGFVFLKRGWNQQKIPHNESRYHNQSKDRKGLEGVDECSFCTLRHSSFFWES